jgi:Holliday junction resolvasome RuvABC endonuclease subunit
MSKLTTIKAGRNTAQPCRPEADVILGVDPGYATMGLALVWRRFPGRYALLWGTTLRLDGSWDQRAPWIVSALNEALISTQADALALESITQSQVSQFKRGHFNVSNLRVNEVIGLIRGWAMCRFEPLPLIELQPTRWKPALGIGARAEKAQVKRAVMALVADVPERCSEHLADAIGIAVGGFGGARRVAG